MLTDVAHHGLMTEPPFQYPHDEGQLPPETHQQETAQFAVPSPQPSFWQRYKAALLAGALVLVLVIAGAVWAVAASSTSEATPSASSSPAPTSGAAKDKGKDRPVIRGTVTAEDGDTWTVKTDKGDTVQVTISDATKFGTAKAPADKTKITVNSKVIVTGKNTDGKVEARRIRLPQS
ncbi:DUF5666 domain-containing protein [Labedaea rhizosphaerae]|uniref:DUF5666 domain-containing protein n=1 Tax=Labedaea rhizosphaerae TaxID=598644 RepID=A0A4R6RVU8_LABRH|nr:DUF5666 domain-containing protein [Labedaea rhizosphaerae]TDP91100.1 hypothetical protein EV186_10992 [Labedaea rhizosphaerae]